MDALSVGCTVISVLCLLGALGALVALPGRRALAAAADQHEAADKLADQYAVRPS